MSRSIFAGALSVALIIAGAGIAGAGPSRPAAKPNAANFISFCLFSHRAPDDPIVAPNQPGGSHSHDFLGNDTTSASSTLQSLRAGTTSCKRAGDTAAYWVPTLLNNGIAINPTGVNAYYLSRGKTKIKPFPAGLKVIAGDAKATRAQPLNVVSWSCGPEGGTQPQSAPPSCPDGVALRLHIRFPDCWNGSAIDSADHKSHLAYSRGGSCPTSHAVPVPGLQLNVIYPIRGGSGVSLASGASSTGHADFFNAWNQDALTKLVNECLNAGKKCGHN